MRSSRKPRRTTVGANLITSPEEAHTPPLESAPELMEEQLRYLAVARSLPVSSVCTPEGLRDDTGSQEARRAMARTLVLRALQDAFQLADQDAAGASAGSGDRSVERTGAATRDSAEADWGSVD